MNETLENKLVAADKAPSALEELLAVQQDTVGLIARLRSRLSVVSHATPESGQKDVATPTHIIRALENQYGVNSALREILDQLAV